MNVLVISPIPPCPPDIGDKIRVYHSIKALLRRHNIKVLSLSDSNSSQNDVSFTDNDVCGKVKRIGEPTGSIEAIIRTIITGEEYRKAKFYDEKFFSSLKKITSKNEFDIIWVHFRDMLQFLKHPDIQQHVNDAQIVLDQHNDFVRFWSTYKESSDSMAERLWSRLNIRNIKDSRGDDLALCDIVLSVSGEDARSTQNSAPDDTTIWVAPNGVDFEHYGMDPSLNVVNENHRIIYVGSMDVRMNVDAVVWFSREILPGIHDRFPDVHFDIVGRNPTDKVRSLAKKERVRVTGHVDDPKPYYREATIAVVPSRLGGGTKLKLPEAMAAGVPVVATSVGAQGIEIEDGKHLYVADNETAFTAAVVSLLENSHKAEELAQAAQKHVRERYSWKAIYNCIVRRIEDRACL
jgi:glycosyltransferase involved in cell wall biosynthesis